MDTFQLPADLRAAVVTYLETAWELLPGDPAGIPAQGSMAVRALVEADLAGIELADRPAVEAAAQTWIDAQVPLQERAALALERTAAAWPEDELPRFFGNAWWIDLRFPWCEDLAGAVIEAEAWLEANESA